MSGPRRPTSQTGRGSRCGRHRSAPWLVVSSRGASQPQATLSFSPWKVVHTGQTPTGAAARKQLKSWRRRGGVKEGKIERKRSFNPSHRKKISSIGTARHTQTRKWGDFFSKPSRTCSGQIKSWPPTLPAPSPDRCCKMSSPFLTSRSVFLFSVLACFPPSAFFPPRSPSLFSVPLPKRSGVSLTSRSWMTFYGNCNFRTS